MCSIYSFSLKEPTEYWSQLVEQFHNLISVQSRKNTMRSKLTGQPISSKELLGIHNI